MELMLEKTIAHGGHPALRWMMDNIFVRTDPAGNIKPDKEKFTEKIDGAVAIILGLDRTIRNSGNSTGVYMKRGGFYPFSQAESVLYCIKQIGWCGQ